MDEHAAVSGGGMEVSADFDAMDVEAPTVLRALFMSFSLS